MIDQFDAGTPMVTASFTGYTYTVDQIRRAFPAKILPAKQVMMGVQPVDTMLIQHQYASQIRTAEVEVAAKYPILWSGDWIKAHRPNGSTGYPSCSEADLALAGHIARACQRLNVDEAALPGVVEAVFRISGQGKAKKWITRADYRQRTILAAISSTGTNLTDLSLSPLLLKSHGDIRNGQAFADIARGIFVYVTNRNKWIWWLSEKWKLCEKDEPVAQAKAVCKEIYAAAGSVLSQDPARGRKLVQEAVTAHNLPRILAMLKLAASEPGMAVTERELDSDPYLLGVQNGVVDLRTGRLLTNEPNMYVTRYCTASYDTQAKCDRWVEYLVQTFNGDRETIESVERLLGCTLLGSSGEEILVICYGHGSNGKSVFSNVIHTIMGDYAVTAPPTLLTVRKGNDSAPRNDVAALAGARYVSINEMQAGDRLDEQVVKSLAGREPISARFLHQEFFEFMPIFTPWMRTNHKPIVTGDDDGIWRRLVLLPFDRTFADDEKDPDLEKKLLDERDGILMRMIAAAGRYQKDGLKLSPRIKAECATYRSESDLLGEFLAECTVSDNTGRKEQKAVYAVYRDWCINNGVRCLSKKSFTQRLAERGYREFKSGGVRFYVGLKLSGGNESSPF